MSNKNISTFFDNRSQKFMTTISSSDTFSIPARRASEKFSKEQVKVNQILPHGPTLQHLKLATSPNFDHKASHDLSFREAFGVLGIPMLGILIVCFTWTSWLVSLALAPNEAANALMNTGDYDNGRFWYIADANPSLTLVGAAGLVIVAFCYLFVILKMLLWRNNLILKPCRSKTGMTRIFRIVGPSYERIQQLWTDLTSYQGKNRKRWNAFLKLVDLAMETMMLRQLLQSGSPVGLTYGFAGFLALNSLSCIVNVLTDRFSALMEIFIDSIFDLAAAVLFPILTLVYCYYNFDFDRAAYLTYLEKLPLGSFEHIARSFADPSEVALFRVNFDSLRINSLTDFTIRISMNLALCFRFQRVLQALILARYREYASRGIKRVIPQTGVSVAQNPVPRGFVVVYLAIILLILLSTHKAVKDSDSLCSAHPECVVYTHQWATSDKHCPCIILIDVDLAPKTYEQWVNAVNAYDKVKTLASAGTLTSLQVINRKLADWPEELRTCRGLKTIQLIYTDIQSVPYWAKELRHLETIQIEGRYGSPNLISLPDEMFADLPRLSMIHLGIHVNLQTIPALTGVPNLQSLTLAWTNQVRELPSFEHVPKLSRLVLSLLPRLERIPDLSPLQNLVEFVVFRPSHICCNGYVGPCNLAHVSCQANLLLGTSPAICLTDEDTSVTPFLGSFATQKAFEKFAPYICQENLFDKLKILLFPTQETIEMCKGKPFKQCEFPGQVPGICFNTRFQVLSCVPDENYIALRRFQIEKGVGPTCDPVVEKWLGCKGINII